MKSSRASRGTPKPKREPTLHFLDMRKRQPKPRPTLRELFTPENIAKATTADLTYPKTAGVPWPHLRQLRTIKRIHTELVDLSLRVSHGLSLPREDRRWAHLLSGPLACLRILLGPDDAAPFFFSRVVIPASQSLSPTASRVFLQEMQELPFTEQGEPLGKLTQLPTTHD